MAHKKYKRKYLNILLIPDDESSPRSIKLRYSILTAAVILLIFIAVGLIIGIFTYGQLVEKAYQNIRLTEENDKMKVQLQKINDLQVELDKLKSMGKKVHNTLTGYVNIADGTGSEQNTEPQPANNEELVFSILKSIPLKAPLTGFISQEYKSKIHNGIDIVAPIGSPIAASASGTVLYSDWSRDGGNTIIIGHDNGYFTYYKHNLQNIVQMNEKIEQGQIIGYLGDSGEKSYGPHLHFEIWKNGKSIDPKILVMEYNN